MSPPFKPMKRRDYEHWIGAFGWSLVKTKRDWKLLDSSGGLQIKFIKVTHPGGEIPAYFVKETEKALNEAGLIH